MKFKVELFVGALDFDIPENKSKSMIAALQREQVMQMVFQSLIGKFDYIEMGTVRKVQTANKERTCK